MAESMAPLTPSIIEPKYIPILSNVPGSRKDMGIPIHICIGLRCPKGIRTARK